MPFVITCRAWKALFKAKETTKQTKKKLAKLESKERKKKEVTKDTVGTSNIKKNQQ
jgi:hypothetical protein